MKKSSLSKLTNDELVARYVEIGAAQGEALNDFDNPRYNRLYDKKIAVVNELRSRPGDQRKLLISLFDHRIGRSGSMPQSRPICLTAPMPMPC